MQERRRFKMYFEEVELNKIYREDRSKTVTGSEIDIVAQLSGMDLPGFLDAEFAKGWGFKNRVTPGPYIFACMVGLMAKQGFLADAVMVSVESISFKRPVYPGDRIIAEVEVKNKKERKQGGGFCNYDWKVYNQKNEIIAEGNST